MPTRQQQLRNTRNKQNGSKRNDYNMRRTAKNKAQNKSRYNQHKNKEKKIHLRATNKRYNRSRSMTPSPVNLLYRIPPPTTPSRRRPFITRHMIPSRNNTATYDHLDYNNDFEVTPPEIRLARNRERGRELHESVQDGTYRDRATRFKELKKLVYTGKKSAPVNEYDDYGR
jgi:hypothetical protein